MDCIEYVQFAFRFKILLFLTIVRFSTKTLAYKAYKAYKVFMAFMRSRLNPFQKYRLITSFSVDWPRTIRLLYASVSILSVCTIKLQVIVKIVGKNCNRKPKTLNLHRQNNNPTTYAKWLTREFYKQISRGSSCDLALSVHDNVSRHQDNTRDQHVNTFTSLDHS